MLGKTIKIRILITGIVLSFYLIPYSYGQQDPTFSQYMFNQMYFNPAVAGSSDLVCMNLSYRDQWMGFVDEGAPTISSLNIHTPFKLFGASHGVGLSVLNDQIAFNNDIGVKLNYSLQLDVGIGKLGIGLYGGVINNAFNPDWNFGPGGNATTDDAIPIKSDGVITPDFGVGLYYSSENIYLGFSSLHITQSKIKYETNGQFDSYFLKRKFYVTSGYSLELTNPMYELEPSVLMETDLATSQITLGSRLIYNKKIWGGVFYRTGKTFVAQFGVELFDGIKIGVSYDYSLSEIQDYSDGSLEVMVGYCFSLKKEKTPQKYKSIRFL